VSGPRDEEFRPRPARIGDRGRARAKPFLSRIVGEVRKAGGAPGFGRGRGRKTRVAPGRWGFARPGGRRVIVKARIVRLQLGGLKAQLAHVSYIRRDGVERDGAPGRLYDAARDEADGRAFAERCEPDRHQFRFIVSPEDGAELAALRPFVRGLMAQAEQDLESRLDWVAADHWDTAHPHSHIVLRGVRDDGRDLVIPRDYIAHGLRARASELLTLELGPESALEAMRRRTREIGRERLTSLDGRLRGLERGGVVRLEGAGADRAVLTGRLATLKTLGLAETLEPGVWRLADAMERTLEDLGERADRIEILTRRLAEAGLVRPLDAGAVWSGGSGAREGRLVALGLADAGRGGFADRAYAVVDGTDGRARYVDLGGERGLPEDLAPGDIVAVEAAAVGPRASDRTIAAVAARSGGVYDADSHRALEPRASDAFVQTHVRRLEALRRQGLVERQAGGRWRVPEDYLERVEALEQSRAAAQPTRLVLLARESLGAQAGLDGATWLDRRLAEDGEAGLGTTGFGGEARAALAARRAWLVREGLLPDTEPGRRLGAAGMAELERRSLAALAARLERELGKTWTPARVGERVEGVYRGAEMAGLGKVAIIERAKEFSLVPWRDVLERARGAQVAGVVMDAGVDWSFGRRRTLGPT
jgi:type IV secretory pathway VirD2 relaxase